MDNFRLGIGKPIPKIVVISFDVEAFLAPTRRIDPTDFSAGSWHT